MIAKIIDNKTIHVYDKSQFDPVAIQNSGQVFFEPPCDFVEQEDMFILAAHQNVSSQWLFNYFDLSFDYNIIKRSLQKFSFLSEPIRSGGGLRILRQPFIRTVISFIISANNNIKRFSKTLAAIDFDNLSRYTESDFKALGCGYRAAYLVKTISMLAKTQVNQLEGMTSSEFKSYVLGFCGVGEKVANCIVLFSDILPNSQRYSFCPVDTWINKALQAIGEQNAKQLLAHPYSGVAQQYLFYYLQHLKGQL